MAKNKQSGFRPLLESLESREVPAGVNWVLDPSLVDLSRVMIHFKSTEDVKIEPNAYLDGVDVETTYDITPGIYSAKIDPSVDYTKTLDSLLQNPAVERIDQNFRAFIQTVPNDPRYNEQWAYNNTGQLNGTPGADIKAQAGWDIGTGTGQTIVAVIDSGVDYNHQDLKPNMWVNTKEIPGNGIDDDKNGFTDDQYGIGYVDGVFTNDPYDDGALTDSGLVYHGTHCAGIVGAAGNNNLGVTGTNWNAKIMTLKVFGSNVIGCTFEDVVACMDYAVKMGSKVISLSLGGPGGSAGDFFDLAIKDVGTKGVVVIAAAGNGGDDGVGDNNDTLPNYPSNYNQPNLIAVAASTNQDVLTSFSNFGVTSVDLAAPGQDILSTQPNNSYDYMSGTSMATPMVAGAMSLLMDLSPGQSAQFYVDRILSSVDKMPAYAGRVATGGRLNLQKTLPTDQLITFPDLSPVTYGVAPVQLNATGGRSNNPITYKVISGPGVIEGSTVKVIGAGAIVIQADQAGNSIYLPALSVTKTLIVNQAALTVQAVDGSRVYGGAAFTAFSYIFSGFVNSDTAAVLGGLNSTTTDTANSPVGSYDILPFATSPNYSFTFVKGALLVTPAALTMKANDASRTYGDSSPTFSATFTGFVLGDTEAVITEESFTTTATVASPVGKYLITPFAKSANYNITFTPGTLAVTKAKVTLTADAKTKIYGASLPELTSSVTGLVNGDTASIISNLSLSTTGLASSSVGTFPITVTGSLLSPNYDLVLANGILTVAPAPITVIADNKNKLYGDDLPALTVHASGFVNGDSDLLLSSIGVSTVATKGSAVGEYQIKPSGVLGSSNYVLNLVNGILKVDPAALTITAIGKNKVYGAPLPTFTTKVTGLVNGDTEALIAGLGATTTGLATSPVGIYPVIPKGTNANYQITYVNGSMDVTQANLLVKANDSTRVYGSANPAFSNTFTGLVNGDTPASISGILNSTIAAEKSNVGGYAIVPSGVLANYNVTYQSGNLIITPAPITLTAEDKTKVYGTANPVLTSTFSGVLAFDNPAQVIAGLSGIFPAGVTEKTGVGSYAIEPAATLLSSNYYIGSKINASLLITPATLTVKAENGTKVYGAPMPVLDYTVTGLVNGDDPKASIAGLGATTPAQNISEVGTYPLYATGTSATPNYVVVLAAGLFEVTKAKLRIAAVDAMKVYGDAMPNLTTEVTGLVNFDSLAAIKGLGVTTSARFFSPVGDYLIVPSGTNPNYDITLENANLTVTKAALTISAGNYTKVYGAPMPELSATITGLVNADTRVSFGDLVISSFASGSSSVGNFPVTVSASNPNYDITFVNGNVSVTPAPLTITGQTLTKVYGAPVPELTAPIVTGLVNGDTIANIVGLGESTTALKLSKVGTYPISPTGASSNYQIQLVPGELSVTKAELTVVADDKSVTKGSGASPVLTYRLDGLVEGDTSAALTGTPVLISGGTSQSAFGTYPIVVDLSEVTSANYVLASKNATLSVVPVTNSIVPAGSRPSLVTFGGVAAGISLFDGDHKLGAINPFPGYAGRIQTAMADFNGDGILDIVASTGAGISPQVRIFSGVNLQPIQTIVPYATAFKGGVSVMVADVDGDQIPEIITGTGNGSAPHVKIYKADGTQVASFYAYAPNFTRGVNLASGDFNGDGKAELVTWPNAGGGPNVKVFDGTGKMEASFYAYSPVFTGGFSLSVGDVSGDSRPEIITGSGPGTPSSIRVFNNFGQKLSEWNPFGTLQLPVVVKVANLDGALKSTIVAALGGNGPSWLRTYTGQGTLVGSTTVFANAFRSGLSLSVVNSADGKKQELVVGGGAGSAPEIKRYETSKLTLVDSLFAAGPNFRGGLGLS